MSSAEASGVAPEDNFFITYPLGSMLQKQDFFPTENWETIPGGFKKLSSEQQFEFLENFHDRYTGKPVTKEAIKCCLKSMENFSTRIEGLPWLQKVEGTNDGDTGVLIPLNKIKKLTLVSIQDIKDQLQ